VNPSGLPDILGSVEISKPPVPATVTLRATFDDVTGVLAIGYTAPPLTLGSTLAYKLSADEARSLARALETYANRGAS
jgi:hypothetical protein